MISGLLEPAVDRELTGWLFVKGLALVYAVAFASLGVQIDGLVGPDGILPFGRLLHGVYAEQGITALARLPTLFWLDSSGTALRAAAFGGTAVAVLLALGWVRSRPALIVLFVLYLSLVQAGQIFTLFQWDTLLLESGFLAIFLADSPTRLNVLTLEWLLFRLRFESGFFKLASGDPPWRHFTALNYYFETQPLPHIGSWYAQQLPIWLKQTGVGFTFFTELVVPFLIFLPRPFRLFAACVTIFAQLLIIATSNHNFINLLTIVLCLFLLDDRIVALVVPASLQERIRARARARAPGIAGKAVTGAAAALVVALSVSTMLATQMTEPLPRALVALDRIAPAFGIGADYHLFPTMQTERQELRIFGSYDGKTWQAYVFRYKPDALDRAPKFIVPYQPRLDWMMWFVPPQWPDTDFWLDPFLQALRQNRPAVTRLLKSNPFEGKAPPTQLRVLAYRYRFTTPQERGRTGNWWQAEYLGEFPDVPPRRP
ncbi:MAG: lipase maturation factor family protein [Burkholderiaceae bacterium]|nr:lipase maturation factor family protein [Burkholderiaceae bacterium]